MSAGRPISQMPSAPAFSSSVWLQTPFLWQLPFENFSWMTFGSLEVQHLVDVHPYSFIFLLSDAPVFPRWGLPLARAWLWSGQPCKVSAWWNKTQVCEISSLFSGNESMMLIDVTDLFLMTSCWALSNTCHLGGQKMGEKIKSYVRFSCQQNSNTAYNIWIGNASDSEIQSHQFTIPLDESRADQRSKQRLSCRERVAVRSSINTKPPRTILYYTVSIFLSKIRYF